MRRQWQPWSLPDVTGTTGYGPGLVLAAILDSCVFAQETRDESAVNFFRAAVASRLDVQGDFHQVTMPVVGLEHGGKATLRLGNGGGTRLGVESRRLRSRCGYVMGRAFCLANIPRRFACGRFPMSMTSTASERPRSCVFGSGVWC